MSQLFIFFWHNSPPSPLCKFDSPFGLNARYNNKLGAPETFGRWGFLLDQNREHWDQLLFRRGLAALHLAESMGNRGPYRTSRDCRLLCPRADGRRDRLGRELSRLYRIA